MSGCNKKSVIEKARQLKMSAGKARHILHQNIMFDLVVKLGLNVCCRCNEKIEEVKQFSVDHKEPWLHSEDPLKLYFDLDNIGFAHLSCNSKAARYTPAACGTVTKYNKGCRCSECTEAQRLKIRRIRARKKVY